MSIYYEITPVDTLFFRGAEPLEAGLLANTGLFPPPVSVISGALRTAVLQQRNISFEDYKKNKISEEVLKLVGQSGTQAPFYITAVLLKRDEVIYAPAPYSWFIDNSKPVEGSGFAGKTVYSADYCNTGAMQQLSICTSIEHLPLAVLEGKELGLGGNWIKLELLQQQTQFKLSPGDICTPSELCCTENRTGISLLDEKTNRPTRQVRDGALFTAGHVRLNNGVSIIIGISQDCGLLDYGFLTLGGEQRMSGYTKIELNMPNDNGNLYVSLSPVELTDNVSSKVFCAGKAVTIAGWDLHKKFHKPSRTWLPAGTVFTEKINKQCISLAQ